MDVFTSGAFILMGIVLLLTAGAIIFYVMTGKRGRPHAGLPEDATRESRRDLNALRDNDMHGYRGGE